MMTDQAMARRSLRARRLRGMRAMRLSTVILGLDLGLELVVVSI